jgi:predicted PurR-regulated permease PerM
METTLSKSKTSKKTLLKISMILFTLFISVFLFFTHNNSLEFITKYFENSNAINIVIITIIFLAPLFGFLIPLKKTSPEERKLNSLNKKRRITENRRKKELMRLVNANNRRI